MSDTGLVVGLAVLVTLAAVVVIGGAAICAALFVHEHMARRAAEQRAGQAETTVHELRERLAALQRVDRNELYRYQLEDLRARELRASDSIYVAVEHLRQAARTLDTAEKGKRNK
jgi:uncharacterized membrane protein